jgi:large conductance mechanosensitive channel
MKKFFQDFKKFISRGNIIDMAIGVVVGNAFSAIVKAFTDKIIMPLINFLLTGGQGGKDGLVSAYTYLKKSVAEDGTIDLTNSIYIDWGSFITAILNFFIIAFTLFVILRVAMKSNQLFAEAREKYGKEFKLTRAERKELKKQGKNPFNFDDVREYKLQKNAALAAEVAKKEAEEKAKAEADRLANPTQEDLLKEIRDLLKAKSEKPAKKESK